MLSLPTDPLDRSERFARAQTYVAALGLVGWRAIVFGSVARGDFTADSDTDVLVVSDELPLELGARLDRLASVRDVAPEVEPIGWREEEWQRRAGQDPFVEILLREGVALRP